MKTIFDPPARQELIKRINSLDDRSTAQWGKMNVYQMVRHCVLWQEMILGRKKYKQSLFGKLFGKMLLKNEMKDDRPMARSTPTLPEFKITGTGDLAAEKDRWVELIREHERFENHDFVHPFFGRMNQEQIGYHAYKHIDHHLRQFNS